MVGGTVLLVLLMCNPDVKFWWGILLTDYTAVYWVLLTLEIFLILLLKENLGIPEIKIFQIS